MRRSEYGEHLDFAIDVSGKAGKMLLERFHEGVEHNEKHDGTYVTKADHESEKMITESIEDRYPDHGILTEEGSDKKGDSEYLWIIDPLDGTHNFIFGIPLFGVSIALMHKKKVVAGTISLPAIRKNYYAEIDRGAFSDGSKISVNKKGKENSILALSGLRKMVEMYDLERIYRLTKFFKNTRKIGASCAEFSLLSSGSFSVLIETDARPWDISAGALIVEEAGGKVTDFHGKLWNPWSKQIIASNGLVHERILEILNK